MTVIHKEAGGESSSVNRGLDLAEGNFVAILEGDVAPHKDWLTRVLRCLEDPDVVAAGGRLLTPREDAWIARLAGYEVEYRQSSFGARVSHLTTANVLYRKEAFDRYGRFDEGLYNSCLDVEFSQRLLSHGHKLASDREAVVYHHYKPSLMGYLRRQFAYARYRPFLKSLHALPKDLQISLQLLATGLSLVCLPVVLVTPLPLVATLICLFCLQCPIVAWAYRNKNDPVVLAFFPVLYARNVAGGLGLALGLVRKMVAGLRSDPGHRG